VAKKEDAKNSTTSSKPVAAPTPQVKPPSAANTTSKSAPAPTAAPSGKNSTPSAVPKIDPVDPKLKEKDAKEKAEKEAKERA
jgi:hypothetical protein